MDRLEAWNKNELSIEEIARDIAAAAKSNELHAIRTLTSLLINRPDIELTARTQIEVDGETQHDEERISGQDVAIECLAAMAELPDQFRWDNTVVKLGRPSQGTYREIPLRGFNISLSQMAAILTEANLPVPVRWSLGDEQPSRYHADIGREGGASPKYNQALQDAVNRLVSEARTGSLSLTLRGIVELLRSKDAVATSDPASWSPYSFEPPIPDCDDLYIDGQKLVWTDRDGREQHMAFTSLRRYIGRAKEPY